MKDGLALIYKIWSDLKEKDCCRRAVNIERGKWGNGNKIAMRPSWMKQGEREKEREERGERERK
jgi:hypothetical protein